MLVQETINEPGTLLKLFVNLDDQLRALQSQLNAHHLPRDPRGGVPQLRTAEVLTMLIFGAWLGLTDKAKLYYYFQRHHRAEFPALPHYSKFVAATNRVLREAGALLGRQLQANARRNKVSRWSCKTRRPYRAVRWHAPNSTARSNNTPANHATAAATGTALNCTPNVISAGGSGAVRLTVANVDDRQLLDPFSEWIETGISVGERGYFSQERARELERRGLHLYTPNRKNMKKLATPFQVACLQEALFPRNRVHRSCIVHSSSLLLSRRISRCRDVCAAKPSPHQPRCISEHSCVGSVVSGCL